VSRLPSWDLCLTNYPLSSCYFATAHPRMGEPAEENFADVCCYAAKQ
jgi:hypothetical protein